MVQDWHGQNNESKKKKKQKITNAKKKKRLESGSSCKAPVFQAQGPDFNTRTAK
jgi:hypothetical protein